MLRLGAAAAVAAAAMTPCARAQPQPFTQEALARGISFTMRGHWGPFTDGSHGFGMAMADLDDDGDMDLVLVGRTNGLPGVFENDGNGVFSNRSFTSGLPAMPKAAVVLAFDYDGDRDLDLFIGVWAEPDRFFRNDGGLVFTEVTTQVGLGANRRSAGGCVADFDGDGWLDLHVPIYSDPKDPARSRDLLYRNRGDGTFEEIATALGVASEQPGLQSLFFDLDGDSWPDLYLGNDHGNLLDTNRLWRNVGGVFEDVSESSGAAVGLCSMSIAIGDLDGDLRPDLYLTNAPSSVPPMYDRNPLLLQSSPGQFALFEETWGVAHRLMSWGSSFWDFDNDGDVDLYVHSEDVPNSLYRNHGFPPMVDEAAAFGLGGNAGDSYSSAIGDIDRDGDLDMIQNNLSHPVQVFVNHEGQRRRWIRLRVEGDHPNWHAIGATVVIRHGPNGDRSQWSQVRIGGNGYLSQHEATIHFGLDDDEFADEIEVRWPSGGPVRTLRGLAAGFEWRVLPPERLGDLDGDGLVASTDRELLLAWLGAPLVPGREAADLDGDADVDRADLALLWARGGWSRADLNLDGEVSGADLAMLLGQWGSGDPIADIDADEIVGGSDLAMLLGSWTSRK